MTELSALKYFPGNRKTLCISLCKIKNYLSVDRYHLNVLYLVFISFHAPHKIKPSAAVAFIAFIAPR